MKLLKRLEQVRARNLESEQVRGRVRESLRPAIVDAVRLEFKKRTALDLDDSIPVVLRWKEDAFTVRLFINNHCFITGIEGKVRINEVLETGEFSLSFTGTWVGYSTLKDEAVIEHEDIEAVGLRLL
jgi:hypothetical protein